MESEQLIWQYEHGEREFNRADLPHANIIQEDLSEIILGRADLSFANLI